MFALIFVIIFLILLALRHPLIGALFATLVVTYAHILYRYTIAHHLSGYEILRTIVLLATYTCGAVVAASMATTYVHAPAFHYLLFFMVLYLIGSIMEWVLHRMVMHCYMYWPLLLHDNAFTAVFPLAQLKEQCVSHLSHHKSVKPDMETTEKDKGIVFQWESTVYLIGLLLPVLLLVTWGAGIRINLFAQVAYAAAITIVFTLLWNHIHSKIHKIDGQSMADNAFLRNHSAHHRVKGKDKGNFNIIFLGADELFNSNRA